jgi:hypothetical protein
MYEIVDALLLFDVLFFCALNKGHEMTSYLDQIAVEKQKIDMFQGKIDQCKKRIASLEFLMGDSDDALDALASNMITATTHDVAPIPLASAVAGKEIQPSVAHDVREPKKRLADNTVKLLKLIGKEGKELKELVDYSMKNNLNMRDQNIRNFAMIYRKQYGYIENPRKGFYRLTEAGQNAVETL